MRQYTWLDVEQAVHDCSVRDRLVRGVPDPIREVLEDVLFGGYAGFTYWTINGQTAASVNLGISSSEEQAILDATLEAANAET
jgi:hypothetical protein